MFWMWQPKIIKLIIPLCFLAEGFATIEICLLQLLTYLHLSSHDTIKLGFLQSSFISLDTLILVFFNTKRLLPPCIINDVL